MATTNLGNDELSALDSSFANSSATNHLWLVEFHSSVLVDDDLPDAKSAVAYFVSSCVTQKILHQRKRVFCKITLIDARDTPDMNSCILDEHKDIFEMVSRSGV